MKEIWDLSDQMGAAAHHDLVGDAFILITKIEGGGYIAVPGACKLSLICKVLPGQSLDEAVVALEAAIERGIADTGCSFDISYPAGRDHTFGGSPTDIDRSNPAIAQLSQALAASMPERGTVNGAPYWSEAPFLIERLGCPTVYCAPGNIANCHTLEERISINEYLAGITAFAAFIVRYCGTVE